MFSPRKNKEAHDVEDVGRISMYVKLFDGEFFHCHIQVIVAGRRHTEMLRTVLASESYLFTQREIWVLNHILNLPCE